MEDAEWRILCANRCNCTAACSGHEFSLAIVEFSGQRFQKGKSQAKARIYSEEEKEEDWAAISPLARMLFAQFWNLVIEVKIVADLPV